MLASLIRMRQGSIKAAYLSLATAGLLCVSALSVANAQAALPSCTIYATPQSIPYGASSTIAWTSSATSNASIDHGIGAVMAEGSKSLTNFISTITYKLTVSGPGGSSQCSTTISVGENPNPMLSCSLTAVPATIKKGEKVTLTWSSRGAATASFVGVSDVEPSGTHDVYPEESTNFVLTVYKDGKSATCSAPLTISSSTPATATSVSSPQLSAPPNTGSVNVAPLQAAEPQELALSDIPYTGFDFGPLGNTLYWLVLSAFAAAGAYLIVYYKGGVAAFYEETKGLFRG